MWTIRPSATACQQPNGNSGRAAGVPLIIYLCFNGGNRSSVATTKRWLIKACLFRNQNLLLDRLLHLVPIISSSSPSHMLNSTHMWELHHIRMHVFLWCTVHRVCVRHPLLHHAAFKTRASLCIYRRVTDFARWPTSLRVSSILWPLPFIHIKMSARDLAWVENFSVGLRRMTRIRSGFQRNNNGLHCGFNSCFPLSPKKNPAVRGGTSCFILAPLLLKDLNHSLSLVFERLTPLSPSLLSAPVEPLLTGRTVLCSLLGF